MEPERAADATAALMGTAPPAAPPQTAGARLGGARMPPIGVPVRKLSGTTPDVAIAQLKRALPGGGGRR